MRYKKRRISKSLNKNDQKVQRKEQFESQSQTADSVHVRFSKVGRLSVDLTYLSGERQVLLQEKREFGPSDLIDFSAHCPGRCGDGTMDLEGKIAAVVNRGETFSQSSGVCKQPIYAGSDTVCGTELQCTVRVEYVV